MSLYKRRIRYCPLYVNLLIIHGKLHDLWCMTLASASLGYTTCIRIHNASTQCKEYVCSMGMIIPIMFYMLYKFWFVLAVFDGLVERIWTHCMLLSACKPTLMPTMTEQTCAYVIIVVVWILGHCINEHSTST
mgnify:CR=1 FL=1